jgi:2OG-Fe(II) oxygenase superfamily
MQALVIKDEFIGATTSKRALDVINSFREAVPLPIISRASGRRPLRYSVINGRQIFEHLPQLQRLHERTTVLVKQIFGQSIEPLADDQVAININITQPGGSYRYHYDRNAITAILYLNETRGGETECYPNHRLRVRDNFLQREVDRVFENQVCRWIFGRQVLVRPRAGRLLIMRGDRCLHSVREVSGSSDRINVVMSYDVKGARYANSDRLNSYLYTAAHSPTRDPNYI